MANRTIYSCDRCKKDVAEKSALVNVLIRQEGFRHDGFVLDFNARCEDICRECAENMGFVFQKKEATKDEVKAMDPPVTDADQLFEIVQNMIGDAVYNSQP